eukprot:TRINITY_DN3499_c0_g2_i1.p1 TRINITY_DN3499_c0_g2~~TRINITY_DN3499_c0_g2_i1.p1  ORF type:complete len:462 (-),score=17.15 TRINITY_DN3499_c0_g2_i1:309-1694(-)
MGDTIHAIVQDCKAVLVDVAKESREKVKNLKKQYNMNIDELCEALAEASFDEKKLVGLQSPVKPKPLITSASAVQGSQTCDICFTDVPKNAMHKMSCGHPFCKECWRQHIETQLMASPAAALACKCMQADCKKVVSVADMRLIVDDKHVQKYFRIFYQRMASEKSSHYTSCRSCARTLQVHSHGWWEMCPCSTPLCPQCGDEPHEPLTCSLLQNYREREARHNRHSSAEDSEQWVQKFSKKCPRCKVPIQKNDGCNHMSCSQCSFQFCWLCLKGWAPRECSCNQMQTTDENSRTMRERVTDIKVQKYLRLERETPTIAMRDDVRCAYEITARGYRSLRFAHILLMYTTANRDGFVRAMKSLRHIINNDMLPTLQEREVCDPSYMFEMSRMVAHGMVEMRTQAQQVTVSMTAPEQMVRCCRWKGTSHFPSLGLFMRQFFSCDLSLVICSKLISSFSHTIFAT